MVVIVTGYTLFATS